MKTKEWYKLRQLCLEEGMSEDRANRIADANHPEPVIEFAGADWKDTPGMAKAFIKVLHKKGFFVYEDPTTKGSDYINYIISDIKLGTSDVKNVMVEVLGEEFFSEMKKNS